MSDFLLFVAVVWTVVSLPAALLIGHSVRLADKHEEKQRAARVAASAYIPREWVA